MFLIDVSLLPQVHYQNFCERLKNRKEIEISWRLNPIARYTLEIFPDQQQRVRKIMKKSELIQISSPSALKQLT